MKRKIRLAMRSIAAFVLIFAVTDAPAQRQMEYLDRGLVALRHEPGRVFISWRLLGTEPSDLAFNLYRSTGGDPPVRLNDEPLIGGTNFVDENVDMGRSQSYFVRGARERGEEAPSRPFTFEAEAPVRPYLSIPLRTPEGYRPNDGSVGDLTGDGRYELIVKMERRSRDNAHAGMTDPTILQAYTLEGELLWQINLGINIRSGAHYTPFLVYDFDGNGRAEIVCKTADGTTDGVGNVIGDPTADWRNEKGYILAGPEFLTVFDGLTGKALASTGYVPARHPETHSPTAQQLNRIWGDGYGNRVDRFLAGVAYLDGRRPSIIMSRGYYTRAVIAAWDWRESQLTSRWIFDSDDGRPGHGDYRGQGNHQLAIGDVTGNGKDEIIFGAMAVAHDGSGLYSTGLGHGDALHLARMEPDNPRFLVFMPHESPGQNGGAGTSLRDAATGELLWTTAGKSDVGRGIALDIDPRHPGYEMWASNDNFLYNLRGERIGPRPGSMNFGIWWTGDPLRELLDHRGSRGGWHGVVYRWNWEEQKQEIIWEDPETRSNNWTKGNPVLSADILGDWREEMIWRAADNQELRIYTTTVPTRRRIHALMHDPVYRLSVAWQNSGYNQPPHPGFFLGHGMKKPSRPNIQIAGPNAR
jgi:rhamnogalacturonan endolyase